MKSVILFGASGLIGSNLIPLLSRTCTVLAISRKSPKHLSVNCKWQSVDLNRNLDVSQLPASADTIIYLAQSEHFRNFPEKAMDVFRVNTMRTLELLEYAVNAGVKTFIYASSGGVYGAGNRSFSEDSSITIKNDLGFYLSTKLCSEILAENYTIYMNVIVLRFFFVYGQGQRRSMLIPRLVDYVKSGQSIKLQGETGILTNPTHVSDAVNAVAASMNLNRSDIFNIGGPEVLSLREICNLIGKQINKHPVFIVDKNEGASNLVGDIAKMKQCLWSPVVTLENGIKSVLE